MITARGGCWFLLHRREGPHRYSAWIPTEHGDKKVDGRNVISPSQADKYLSSLIGVEGESVSESDRAAPLKLLALSILGSEMEKHPSVSDTKTW